MALRDWWTRRRSGAAPDPAHWGLERRDGQLHLDDQSLVELAERHGTPLHVVSARALRARVAELRESLAAYPAEVRICYSYKTNRVVGVLRVLHRAGCGAEVVDGLELRLADRLGVPADQIVFNGPNKQRAELEYAAAKGVGLIVVDGFAEIEQLAAIAAAIDRRVAVAVRICPDVKPRGMNLSSMTGSRRNQFGFDLRAGEASRALREVLRHPQLKLRGTMAHIGSGIRDLQSIRRSIDRLLDLQLEASEAGAEPDLLDVGGGLGTRMSREFTTRELLTYLALGHLPRFPPPAPVDLIGRYGSMLTQAVTEGCRDRGLPLPTLVLEPGRTLVSDAQLLLLRVGAARVRRGIGRFAMTDGGAMTVSMMFLSEHHALLLANREAPVQGRTQVVGRLPSPMDIVYRGAPLPHLEVGDLLAVMDAGAYFTATETTFGGPRPAVVLIDEAGPRCVRRRETFEDRVILEQDLKPLEGSESHAPG